MIGMVKQMVLTKLFTPKQLHVLDQEFHNHDWQLMINYGAVRAGKTYIDNFVFLYELRHAAEVAKRLKKKYPMYILAGVSSKSLQDNILNEIAETFGLIFKFDQHHSFKLKFPDLPAVKVVQTFTGSISGLGAIRGMTAYGAYINEASLANPEVFEEIRDRCDKPGARVVCDTNPDVPTHWLKTKYIDNPKHTKTIISNHFILDDNTFENPDYIKGLKASTPSGMFYDRKILGLWVAGEGLVYSDFDKNTNVISLDEFHKRTKNKALTYYCGVDWGFEHKGVIVVLADDEDGNTYLIEEHTRKHEDIDYWVNIARGICKRYGWQIPFYCDSARPEYVQRFQDENFQAAYAYKHRLTNISYLAERVKKRKFFVIQEIINQFLDELYQYVWDEGSGEPVKNNDDVMDAWQYAQATRRYVLSQKKPASLEQQSQILQEHGVIDGDDNPFDEPDIWNM